MFANNRHKIDFSFKLFLRPNVRFETEITAIFINKFYWNLIFKDNKNPNLMELSFENTIAKESQFFRDGEMAFCVWYRTGSKFLAAIIRVLIHLINIIH